MLSPLLKRFFSCLVLVSFISQTLWPSFAWAMDGASTDDTGSVRSRSSSFDSSASLKYSKKLFATFADDSEEAFEGVSNPIEPLFPSAARDHASCPEEVKQTVIATILQLKKELEDVYKDVTLIDQGFRWSAYGLTFIFDLANILTVSALEEEEENSLSLHSLSSLKRIVNPYGRVIVKDIGIKDKSVLKALRIKAREEVILDSKDLALSSLMVQAPKVSLEKDAFLTVKQFATLGELDIYGKLTLQEEGVLQASTLNNFNRLTLKQSSNLQRQLVLTILVSFKVPS